MREFELPDLGEGVAEGELVRWLVEVGDPVTEDQPVAEVETDKALVEIPSPVDGWVSDLRVEAGEVVPVGEVLIVFQEAGDEVDGGPEAVDAVNEGEGADRPEEADEVVEGEGGGNTGAPATGNGETTAPARLFAPPTVRRLAREHGIDLSTLDGSGPGGRITEADVRAATSGERAEESTSPRPGEADSATGATAERTCQSPETSTATRDRTLAAPATRRAARELDVDIDAVPATEERDGEAFVTEAEVRAFAEQPADDRSEAATSEPHAEGDVERVPYRGLRRTVGEQMERSAYTAPHVTHHDEADATRLVEVREALQADAEERGVSLTYTPFVVKAVVAALQAFPDLNAELDAEADEIVYKNYYNVGVATATDAGLMVPVVENADEKGLLELATEITDLVAKARDRSIAREEMQGGTFTITNFGAVGGEYATPIINYPEVAILGLGAIEQRPRVVEGEVVPRYTLPLSLSIDHRVVDGAVAARFVNRVIEYVEEPTRLLLD